MCAKCIDCASIVDLLWSDQTSLGPKAHSSFPPRLRKINLCKSFEVHYRLTQDCAVSAMTEVKGARRDLAIKFTSQHPHNSQLNRRLSEQSAAKGF